MGSNGCFGKHLLCVADSFNSWNTSRRWVWFPLPCVWEKWRCNSEMLCRVVQSYVGLCRAVQGCAGLCRFAQWLSGRDSGMPICLPSALYPRGFRVVRIALATELNIDVKKWMQVPCCGVGPRADSSHIPLWLKFSPACCLKKIERMNEWMNE